MHLDCGAVAGGRGRHMNAARNTPGAAPGALPGSCPATAVVLLSRDERLRGGTQFETHAS